MPYANDCTYMCGYSGNEMQHFLDIKKHENKFQAGRLTIVHTCVVTVEMKCDIFLDIKKNTKKSSKQAKMRLMDIIHI